jgi:uncharacterized caspase-like protein
MVALGSRWTMKLHGVFVGIDRYQDGRISTLRYAVSDARRFHARIAGNLAADELSLYLLTDERARREAILRVIGELLPRQVRREDLVLLYFAGHGAPESEQPPDRLTRYLVPYDADYRAIFATALDLERDLPRLLERLAADWIVVILDTCFSGRAGGRTFEGPLLRAWRADWRSVLVPKPLRLSDLAPGEGRVMLAACDDDEVAHEDPRLQQGVFTYFLLQALGEPDGEEDSISLSLLYDRVSRAVTAFTGGRQHPILNGRISQVRLPVLRKVV